MNERFEVRLAGSGGQGLILAGLILAEAAALYDGRFVVQTQSYGPEARGGASKSEVVIDVEEIDYPMVTRAHALLVMSQEACDLYGGQMARNGLIIVDSDNVRRAMGRGAIRLPITALAREVTGREIVANIVGLGVLASMTEIVSRGALEAAVAKRAPQGTVDLNLKALAAGYTAAEAWQERGK